MLNVNQSTAEADNKSLLSAVFVVKSVGIAELIMIVTHYIDHK